MKVYELDYETSPLKTFEQLWNDKGLRDWGVSYWHMKAIRIKISWIVFMSGLLFYMIKTEMSLIYWVLKFKKV